MAANINERVEIHVEAVPMFANDDDSDDNDSSEFADNYNLDGKQGGNDDFTLSEKMVHYLGGHVVPEHWTACKATLVFFAGSRTSKLTVMNKVGKEAACLETYLAAIGELDPSHFCPQSKAFFSNSFRKKDEPISAETLYRYYLDLRNKMRSLIIPLFPPTFASMKSGRGFHESCNDVFVKAFRKDLLRSKKGTMTEAEADAELPPYLWEFKKAPWFLSLAVKVFCRDPQLAPDVADVMMDKENLPISRAALLRIKQEKAAVSVIAGRRNRNGYAGGSVSTTASADDHESIKIKRKVAWAKVHTARAMTVQSNLAKRLGQLSELEKAINLLERIRPVIGEAQYKAKVAVVAASFPNFATFDSEVEVLVVDDNDDGDENECVHTDKCSDDHVD